MTTEHSYIQLGARTYDPEIGRFMSVDPLFEMFPEHSPYHYCYNSPLVYADPSGMFSETETDLDGTIWLISYDIIAVYTPGIDDPLEPHGTKHYEKREISRTRWAGSSAGGKETKTGPGANDVTYHGGSGGSGIDVSEPRLVYNSKTGELEQKGAGSERTVTSISWNSVIGNDFGVGVWYGNNGESGPNILDIVMYNINHFLPIWSWCYKASGEFMKGNIWTGLGYFGLGLTDGFTFGGIYRGMTTAKVASTYYYQPTKILRNSLTIRKDIILYGGRSGKNVKNLTGPANSVLKGSKGRIFITNDKGQVIWDITKNRTKPVIPGKGFGKKTSTSQENLELIRKIWGE